MIADMATAVEAARLVTRKAAWLMDEGDTRQQARCSAAWPRRWRAITAMQVTTDSVQVMGGYGVHDRPPGGADDARRRAQPQIYTGTNR